MNHPSRTFGLFASLLVELFLVLVVGPILGAQEVRFGREAGWKDFTLFSEVGLQKNKEGYLDLTLASGGENVDEDTDLLVHFDHGLLKDDSGNYAASGSPGVVTRSFAHLGDGSAVFHDRTPLVFQAGPNALFGSGRVWRSFTIEFWLYPAQGDDGETVFSWQGTRTTAGIPEGQVFKASFQDSHLVWTLQNLFAERPGVPAVAVSLAGVSTLIPRQWHHHLLRYDDSTGLLEYLVDGVSEATAYVTPSGHEDGKPLTVVTGRSRGQLFLGSLFSGAMDELRIERSWIEDPGLNRYSPPSGNGARGYAVSRIVDLGMPGSKVTSIRVHYRNEGDSEAVFSYRMADAIRYQWQMNGQTSESLAVSQDQEDSSWFRFDPARPLLPSQQGGRDLPKGRYLQLRVDLLPSGTNDSTPKIQEIIVNYAENQPPPPPETVFATAGDGKLTVGWKPVMQGQVDGYLIFFGTSPGRYFGTTASEGPSPIDVGNVTSFSLDGLINDQIYYVTVAAYQKISQPGNTGVDAFVRHLSRNSREISARPQRTLP